MGRTSAISFSGRISTGKRESKNQVKRLLKELLQRIFQRSLAELTVNVLVDNQIAAISNNDMKITLFIVHYY